MYIYFSISENNSNTQSRGHSDWVKSKKQNQDFQKNLSKRPKPKNVTSNPPFPHKPKILAFCASQPSAAYYQ
jgi:hypothetical protein